MFCLSCGAGNQKTKSYCTRCGEWLPDPKVSAQTEFGGSSPQQNIKMIRIMSVLSASFALFSAIALYATHLGTGKGNWAVYVAAAFSLTVAVWQICNLFIALKLDRHLKRGRANNAPGDQNAQFANNSTAPSLPASEAVEFNAGRSVTDRTTELLEPVPRRAGRNP
ncbi:MAG: hypothetical protein H0V27_14980 [Pyrinomonadaceae bacterium]|jgi:hypothetical protein|nr:hypothetical protein [Pyrinomonadaceae bacterium]